MIRLRVKELAQEKKISQGRLSRRADLDLNTVRDIFRDPAKNITLETLNRLANALEVEQISEIVVYTRDE